MRELHSIEAEQSVAGGVIIDPKRYIDISDLITSESFADTGCRIVWDAVDMLNENEKVVDLLTVSSYLEGKNRELYEAIGGIGYLAGLAQGVPSTANIRQYAEIIASFAKERQLYQAAVDIQQVLMQDDMSTDERFQEAEAIFTGMNQESEEQQGGVSMKQAMREYIAELEHRFHNPGMNGLATGIETLDRRLEGLKKGELYVVAARPAMGKTTYAMNIVANTAIAGSKVYISSLEMPRTQLVQRMMAYIGEFDLSSLKSAKVLADNEQSRRVTPVAAKLINTEMIIDDQPALDINELRSRCRRMKRKQGLDLVVVDYLQLLTDRKAKNRFEEVSSISRKLKALAKELECAVIALSQLSRKCEERTDKRPMLSDLRESGQIEQDADVIQFLYRDEIYNENSDLKGVAEIITGKFRDGETGSDYLAFIGSQNKFAELSRMPEPMAKTSSGRGFE